MSIAGKQVLFISYNGMLDPLGQSQVIPYLKELGRTGVKFTLFSFEREHAFSSEGRARCRQLRENLAEHNIDWHWLRYHQRPSLPATCYDVIAGIFYAIRLVRRKRIAMVHARGGIPTIIALPLKRLFKLKLISDVRGLVADEYAEVGHWRREGIVYRVFKYFEARTLRASDGIVTLTESVWPHLREWKSIKGRPVAHAVVPCCADLDRFNFDSAERADRRSQLKVENKLVLVYSGSIGSWYLTDQMADFFQVLSERRTDAFMLWLTQGDPQLLENKMRERGIDPTRYTVRSVMPADVAGYLAASDIGIAFYQPGFSKLATSPVKVAEYLACGIPIVINAGIGDSDLLATQEHVGALVTNFSRKEYEQAATTVLELVSGGDRTRKHVRGVAERLFDVRVTGLRRYTELYETVLGANNDRPGAAD